MARHTVVYRSTFDLTEDLSAAVTMSTRKELMP